jgi:integrase
MSTKRADKKSQGHTFPIGSMSTSLLVSVTAQANSYFFPARGSTSKPFNGWSKSKKALDKLSGVTGWTLHDLRRTFKTNLSRLGVLPHISERLLNHISNRGEFEDTYDLYKYLPEMRAAMDLWEAKLEALFSAERLTA